jgi:hypothetical protein
LAAQVDDVVFVLLEELASALGTRQCVVGVRRTATAAAVRECSQLGSAHPCATWGQQGFCFSSGFSFAGLFWFLVSFCFALGLLTFWLAFLCLFSLSTRAA